MATIDDLVRISGYSRSTVFRFLAGNQIRPAARDAIRTAVQQTGFGFIQTIPPRDDIVIILSVPDNFAGFRGYADAVEGLMCRSAALGIPVVFKETAVTDKRTGTIILGKGMAEEDEERLGLEAGGKPCVLVNRLIDDKGASWASADFRSASADGVRRLAAGGCTRIGCWAGTADHRVDMQKKEGFLLAAAAENITPVFLDGDAEILETSVARVLSSADRPDGWLAFSDHDAMRVIHVAKRLGLRVPEDVSVIGMNDVEGSSFFSPAITSIHIPFRECGVACVDALLRLLDNPLETSVKILLAHRLVERDSCTPIQTFPKENP